MSDEEHTEDDLAMRRRLAAENRSGVAPAAVPIAKWNAKPVQVADSHSCIGCGKTVATIRGVHVECQDCEGKRNRETHERIRTVIQNFKQRRDDASFKRVVELCGQSHASSLKQALEAKGTGPQRARKDDY